MIQHPYWKGRRQQQQQTSLMIVGRLINSRDPLLCPLLSRLSFAFLYFHPWHHVPEIGFPFFPSPILLLPQCIHRIYIYIERDISAAAYCVDELFGPADQEETLNNGCDCLVQAAGISPIITAGCAAHFRASRHEMGKFLESFVPSSSKQRMEERRRTAISPASRGEKKNEPWLEGERGNLHSFHNI